MDYFIELGKVRTNSDPILRSLRDGPDYRPDWRFLVSEEHLIKVAQAKKKSDPLRDILLSERDSFVRQILLYQSGRRCVLAESFAYALRCRRSAGNPIAGMIPAMVVAGRSAIQIAQELGTEVRHIVAYEKLFFDVRRYLANRFWIKNLCYSAGGATLMQQNASRWLITAFERGWDGLSGVFSRPQWPKGLAGQTAWNRSFLGLLSRAADYINALEIAGVAPSEIDMDWLLQIQRAAIEAGATLQQLDYPSPLDPEEEKQQQEEEKAVWGLSRRSRENIVNFLRQVEEKANRAAEDDASRSAPAGTGRDD